MSTVEHLPLGLHAISATGYHADPAAAPSLSRTIAHILCTSSPLHAWTHHPRLNPDYQPTDAEHFDIGTIAHELLLLGDESRVEVIDAPDWRTKDAKEARDAARLAGRTPLLSKHWTSVEAMVTAALGQLKGHAADPPLFTDGKPELSLLWEELGDVVCRARLDWLRDDLATIDDYKTTSRSANPDAFGRALFGNGYDIQAAFYRRGVEAITGVEPTFRFVVQETAPPYALSVVVPGEDVLTIARKKVEYAIDTWQRCLQTGEWPGYPRHVCYAGLPAWEEARWLEKEEEGLAA